MSDRDTIRVDIGLIDPGLRPAREMRAALDEEAIAQYAEDLSLLPPVRLMKEGSTFWVVDGAHTITAATRLGDGHVRAIVDAGDYHAAFLEAAKCNGTHGVPIRNVDKRARVAVALADPVMRKWSDRKIAESCGVTHNFVSEIHAGMKAQLSSDDSCGGEKTVGRDGRARRAPAPRRKADPAPPEEAAAGPPLDGAGDGDGDDGAPPPPDFGILTLSDAGRSLAEAGHGSEVQFRCSLRGELDREADYGPGPYVTLEIGREIHGRWTELARLDLVVPVAWDLEQRLMTGVHLAHERAARERAAKAR
jgi:hypothetical protein